MINDTRRASRTSRAPLGVSIAPEKGGDWLRMQCLPTARGLPFKQDAVFGMSARCSSLGQNTPLRVVKEGQRDRRPTGFPNRQLRDSWAAGSGRPAMLTKMTDADWITVLRVFEAVRSRRGDKGRDDRKFLSALHYFAVHNITWRALPAEFGNWNSVWKRFWRLRASRRWLR
jgi:putative transposase of IS4/5 family DUF4096